MTNPVYHSVTLSAPVRISAALERQESGTSGVASAAVAQPVHDGSGLVAGFCDATGGYLPLACTLNGARVLDFAARLLGVDHAGLSELALQSVPGAHGVTLLP